MFETIAIKLQNFLNTNSALSLTGHLIGMLGMLCIVIAYYAIEKGKYSRDDLDYYLINLTGAVLLIISLIIHFNLGSFVIELFWIVISLQGIARLLKQRYLKK